MPFDFDPAELWRDHKTLILVGGAGAVGLFAFAALRKKKSKATATAAQASLNTALTTQAQQLSTAFSQALAFGQEQTLLADIGGGQTGISTNGTPTTPAPTKTTLATTPAPAPVAYPTGAPARTTVPNGFLPAPTSAFIQSVSHDTQAVLTFLHGVATAVGTGGANFGVLSTFFQANIQNKANGYNYLGTHGNVITGPKGQAPAGK